MIRMSAKSKCKPVSTNHSLFEQISVLQISWKRISYNTAIKKQPTQLSCQFFSIFISQLIEEAKTYNFPDISKIISKIIQIP